MAHKKYIRRNGKVFGPYYYENYRVGDKVKTRYIGTRPPGGRSRLTPFKGNRAALSAIVLAAAFILFLAGNVFTGMLAGGGYFSAAENASFSLAGGESRAFVPQVRGELKDFRISGSVQGNGSAIVYLRAGERTYIVLDTNSRGGSYAMPHTGLLIGPENISEDVSAGSGGEAAPEGLDASTGTTANESAEPLTEFTEPLQDGGILNNVPENVTPGEEAGINVTAQEPELNETVPVDASDGIATNATSENDETPGLPVIIPDVNETLPEENVTVPEGNATITEENVTSQEPELNETVPEPEVEPQIVQTPVTFFEDACEETCIMSASEESYEIIVEADAGTIVKIGEIEYSVLQAPKAPEINISAMLANGSIAADDSYGLRGMIGKGRFSGRVQFASLVKDGDNFSIHMGFTEERGGGSGSIRLYGVGNVSGIRDVQTGEYRGRAPGKAVITTDAVAVNATGVGSAQITLPRRGPVNTILICEDWDFENFRCAGEWEDAGVPFTDNGTHVSFEVSGFSGYAGAQITVISLQSYPDVGGEWAVEFMTMGEADLTITAVNGTSWSLSGDGTDLRFLSLVCDGEETDYEWIGGSVFVGNYSCNGTAYEKSNVQTFGKHVLEFNFGGDVEYARNIAGYAGYKVQSGYSTMAIGVRDTYVPLADAVANVSRAFAMRPHYYACSAETATTNGASNSNNCMVVAELYNTTHVRLRRAASTESMDVDWEVIEALDEEFRVYTANYSWNQASGLNIQRPIGATVNPSYSMVLAWSTMDQSATASFDTPLFRAYAVNSTYVNISRNVADAGVTGNVTWVLVEFDPAKIASFQTGTTTVVAHTQAAPRTVMLATAINMSRSLLLFEEGTATSGIDYVAVAGRLKNDTAAQFYAYSTSSTRSVRWYVIDFGTGTGGRYNGTNAYTSSTTVYVSDSTLSPATQINRSVMWTSAASSGTGTLFPQPFWSARLTNTTTIRNQRSRTGNYEYIEWQVLELPQYLKVVTLSAGGVFPGGGQAAYNAGSAFQAGCTESTGLYNATGVYAILQENSSGSWAAVSSSSSSAIFSNATYYYIGTVGNGTAVYRSFNVTSKATGNYSFRTACNASNTIEDYYYSAPAVLAVSDPYAPSWSLLSANDSTPDVGDSVKFSAYWTDGYNLSSWIFSWNATVDGSWENQSSVGFTGKGNWSNRTMTIPAFCSGKSVMYAFYATDEWGSVNATAVGIVSVNAVIDNEKPQIVWYRATPNETGFGQQVMISANITDNVELDPATVKANITYPNGSSSLLEMSYEDGNVWYAGFNGTWTRGNYAYFVQANDTSGNFNSTSQTPNNFTIKGNATFSILTERDVYGSDEIVSVSSGILQDTGLTNMSGYVTMAVRNAGGAIIAVVVNDSYTQTPRSVEAGGTLDVAALWNASAWNTADNGTGYYSVVANLTDPYGNVLTNDTGGIISGSYVLYIDREAPEWLSFTENDSSPLPLESVSFSSYWQDDGELSAWTLQWNVSGVMEGNGSGTFSSTPGWGNATRVVPPGTDFTTIAWRLGANDSVGNENWTDEGYLEVGDGTGPSVSSGAASPEMLNINGTVNLTAIVADNSGAVDSAWLIAGTPSGGSTILPMTKLSGDMYNASYVPGYAGRYNATVHANDSAGNAGNGSAFYFDVYGWANVSWTVYNESYPNNWFADLSCMVSDANHSSGIEGYPVDFWYDENLIGSSTTDGAGIASMEWDTAGVQAGPHTLNCTIGDNATLYYNASVWNAYVGVTIYNRPSNMAGYKVQSNYTTMDVGTSDMYVPLDDEVTDTGRAFVMMPHYYSCVPETATTNGASNSNNCMVTVYLYNTTDLRIQRSMSTESMDVDWVLVEALDGEFTAYTGSQAWNDASGTDIDIETGATVDVSRSMVLAWSTIDQNTLTSYDTSLFRGYALDSTHIRIQRDVVDAGVTGTIRWVLVEMDTDKLASLQTGTTTVDSQSPAAPRQVALDTPVDMNHSMLIFQTGVAVSGLDQVAIAGRLADSSTIQFYPYSGTAVTRNVRWYVMDFGPKAGNRYNGSETYTSSTAIYRFDRTLSPSVQINRTVFWASDTSSGTGTNFPRPFWSASLPNSSTISIIRSRTGTYHHNEWQALELPQYEKPPVISAQEGFAGGAVTPYNQTAILQANCSESDGYQGASGSYVTVYGNSTGAWLPLSTADSDLFVNVSSYYLGVIGAGSTSDDVHFGITPRKIGYYYFMAECNATNAEAANSTPAVLTVNDPAPPEWSGFGANATNPSTGDYVEFHSFWTEDYNLSSWTFSWNATVDDTWGNYTAGFSGFSGWANTTLQIPAFSSGKKIGCAFYANDSWGNTNVTDVWTLEIESDLDLQQPQILWVNATPNATSYGQDVTIEAAITDNIAVDSGSVMANVTYPNGSTTLVQMPYLSGDVWSYDFNDTWQVGNYSCFVQAQDTSANKNNTAASPINFTMESPGAEVRIETVDDYYSANEDVLLRQSVPAQPAYNVTAFSDDGEWGSAGDCGTNPWDACSVYDGGDGGDLWRDTYSYTGTYAVRAADYDSPGSTDALIKLVDISGCDQVYVSFWWFGSRLDSGEYGTFSINDGSVKEVFSVNSTNQQYSGTGLNTPAPSDYDYFVKDITGVYDFSSPVNFTWNYLSSGTGEVIYFDDLYITCGHDATEDENYTFVNNTGDMNFSYYLRMEVRSNSTGEVVAVQVDEDSPVTSLAGEATDYIVDVWNANNWSTDSEETGYYDVYALMLGPSGEMLVNSTGDNISGHYTFYIDREAPSWGVAGSNESAPAPGDDVLFYASWTDNGVMDSWTLEWNVTGTMAANGSGPLSGSPAWSNASRTVPTPMELYTIAYRFRANDTQGNENVTGTMYVNVRDVTAPSVYGEGAVPAQGNVNESVGISATVTDNSGAPAAAWAMIGIPGDGHVNATMSWLSGNTYNVSYMPTERGTYNATVYANDSAGNAGSGSLLYFDSYGWANVSWAGPDGGSYPKTGTVNLTCLVSDANYSGGIAGYEVSFLYDGGAIGSNHTNSSGYATYAWDTSGIGGGTHTVNCTIGSNATLYYNASAWNGYTTLEILVPSVNATSVEHENLNDHSVNEYEAGDEIGWVNVTVENTGGSAALGVNVTLSVLDPQGGAASWFDAQSFSCGALGIGEDCVAEFPGGAIAEDAAAGTYAWNVTMNWSGGGSSPAYNWTQVFTVHYMPGNVSSSLSPSKVVQNESAVYNVTVENPWSLGITGLNVTMPCPQNMTCACMAGGVPGYCYVGALGAGENATASFNVTTDSSTAPADYALNVTIVYVNPGTEQRTWTGQGARVLAVRGETKLNVSVYEYPTPAIRGDVYSFRGRVNNTGTSPAISVWLNWTLPAGWSIQSGSMNVTTASLCAGCTLWNNITVLVPGSDLGLHEVTLRTESTEYSEDWVTETVTVIAATNMTYVSADDMSPYRNGTLSMKARLAYDNGTGLPGETVTFMLGASVLGANTTNQTGYAVLSATVPYNAALGANTLNATYAGSGALYTNPSYNDSGGVSVQDEIEIGGVHASPLVQGYGQDVDIYADVWSRVQIDAVRANVSYPNGSWTWVDMPYSGSGNTYGGTLGDIWVRGDYEYYIWTDNSAGFGNDTSGDTREFYLRANATVAVRTEDSVYTTGGYVSLDSPGWWDEDWKYRMEINVTEMSGAGLSDYQVNVSIDTAALISDGKMNGDCGDARFVVVNRTVTRTVYNVLSHWIGGECGQSGTDVWVNVPEIPASSEVAMYMYYGNPAAESSENISSTFVFGDDFERQDSPSEGNGWTDDFGYGSIEGGMLKISSGTSSDTYWKQLHHAVASPAGDYVMEYRGNMSQADRNVFGNYFGEDSNRRMTVLMASDGLIKYLNGAGFSDTSKSYSAGEWHDFGIWYKQSSARANYYVDSGLEGTDASFGTSSYTGQVAFGGVSGSVSYWDDVRVRKRASAEPSVEKSGEESVNSVVRNTGATNVSGYLLVQVRNATGDVVATPVNNLGSKTLSQLASGGLLNLSAAWDENPWNTDDSPTGYYTAYAALVGPDGGVLRNDTGGYVNGSYAFYLDRAPDGPVLLEPGNDTYTADNTTFFDWLPAADADDDEVTYYLQVASDYAFSDILVEKEGLAATEYTLAAGEELDNGDYYWRVYAYDGHATNVSAVWGFGVNPSLAVGVTLSQNLSTGINWTVVSFPANNISADGNNGTGETTYHANISAYGTPADLYIRAGGDLNTTGGEKIGLGNETYTYNLTDATVPEGRKESLTTGYALVASGLGDGDMVSMKFFLTVPVTQAPGTYTNDVLLLVVPAGYTP